METNVNIKTIKKSQGILGSLGNILKLMKRRGLLITLSVFEIIRGFTMVQGMSWGLKWITDGVATKDGRTLVLGMIVLSSTIAFITASVIFIEYTCLNTTIKTKSDIRRLIVRSFIGTSYDNMERFRAGDMLYRLNNNVNETAQLYRSLYFFIGSFGKVVGSIIVGFTLSWQLSIIMMTLGIIKISMDKIVIKRLQDIISSIKNIESSLIIEIMEYIKGSVFFRIFGNEKRILNQFEELNNNFSRENLRETRVQIGTTVIMQIFEFGAILMVLWAGSMLVIKGRLSIGSLAAFIGMYDNLINPYRFIGDFMKSYKGFKASYERIEEVIMTGIHNEVGIIGIPRLNSKFMLVGNNITFGYDTDIKVLNNLSFEARAGEVTYITGKSGAGKTTLFRLLMGFKKPLSGQLYVESIGQRLSLTPDLSTHISQSPFLFNGTIWENISLEQNPGDKKAVITAAEKAGIHDFITTLPHGYDTIITDGGKQLSGGQRCRISLARAFYRATPIVLLDEVFSSLDNNTIDLIQRSIDELASGNRCVLMISHRHEWIKPGARVINIGGSATSI